ncbi:histidine kinase [Niveispirillum lacus]|uniref:histidine kinase n=2 Tax=Niveispirillum lacus TaxID=1981099 RepID=A0A255Z5G7_9PROT|nr:histidine kinase [Niveispirillum lacus]
MDIVAIGASAGGLEAASRFVEALGDGGGACFILVQHLDPNHDSLLVDLLAVHTAMRVWQATDGMELLPGQVIVIPPGAYLSVIDGRLHLTAPPRGQGTRLPFDFLLASLARDFGSRVVCVVLSGTGTDGSHGLRAVRTAGGLVIAQDPAEAGYEGMPRSAMATGLVDHVLPVAAMPEVIRNRHRTDTAASKRMEEDADNGLAAIIDLLRTHTPYDFTLYKQGTLRRRIDRRMSMAGIAADGLPEYLELLRRDPAERDNLAKDMLINVTEFFRDPKVFELLAAAVIPGLIRGRSTDNHLRLWVAGCSTGEETYSLAILFLEQIALAGLAMKLQLFASDVDPDAIVTAREGWYPASIAENVSADRLARFFIADGGGYRVTQELRAHVIFTVQDVLADPPFSRLDFISCRNLLIYLMPEAQARVLALFHFALRDGGFLLLGGAETVLPTASDRFEIVSKPARLFRHVGRSKPGDFSFLMSTGDGVRALPRIGTGPGPSRQNALAELCRQLVMRDYAPAAILINRSHDCLYSLGPTDHFLRVPSGHPTQDLLAMTPPGLSVKLRAAIQQAHQEKAKITIQGGQMRRDGDIMEFSIAVHPVTHEGENLMLVCFIDEPRPAGAQNKAPLSANGQTGNLARELDHTRAELEAAIRNLELAGEEQKAVTQEALSINEEYQSANEELLTSKEELQSLNEELTALNSQLQETLDQQRTTSNDLQNVLYSTDVATIFLDLELAIRFFTPATRSLFSILPSDVGRPLADLSSLAADGDLFADAQSVLKLRVPMEREIEARSGAWYLRRVLPYLTRDDQVEGVVITFVDITERRRVAEALRTAKRQAEMANRGKSHFLAAASHDLRQPLQTLILLQGILAGRIQADKDRELLDRIGETIGAMSGMLNALLDINQIEAGVIATELSRFPINDLLTRMRDEFSYHAHARGLALRVVPCGVQVFSDRRLLEQMVRNLLSNALKYTRQGKVLLGCRRRAGGISIEIWDTGIGVPEAEQQAIFEEHHQIIQADGKPGNGLGLGLSIVRRLSGLLNHPVRVRSVPGKGSVFAIDTFADPQAQEVPVLLTPDGLEQEVTTPGNILVVEDDPEVGDLLCTLLRDAGHRVLLAVDAPSAQRQIAREVFRPDLLLVDFNLPGGTNGLDLLTALRRDLHRAVPGLLLTADISTETLRAIALRNELQLHKPVDPANLLRTIQRMLSMPPLSARMPEPRVEAVEGVTIHIIDDDALLRNSVHQALEGQGWHLVDHASAEDFLAERQQTGRGCLLIDAYLPGMGGIDLLHHLRQTGVMTPAIVMTGSSDVPVAVAAMRAGAADFIEKPVSQPELVASIGLALERAEDGSKLATWHQDAAEHLAGLTARQRQIMTMVLAGHPSKNIATDLGISQRTVEHHRAAIMRRTGARSIPALARIALLADWDISAEIEVD